MSRLALALPLLAMSLAASFDSYAAAGLSSRAAGREAFAEAVCHGWLVQPCCVASAAPALRMRLDTSLRLEIGRLSSGRDCPSGSTIPGSLHGWTSQPWHTGLLQASDSSEGETSSGEGVAETTDSDVEQLEFESYLADPHDAGKKGLGTRVSPPWYSEEEDEAVPVGLDKHPEPYRDPVDPGNRASDWVHTPPPPTAGGNWGNWSPFAGLPLTELIWVALVIAFILLAGLLIFALIRARTGETEGNAGEGIAEEEEDPLSVQERIERLPFDLRQGVVDFLEEARRLAAAGKYEEALVYLFSHALVQLDRAHRIRLAKGKTNRQYVAEIESSPPLAQLLSELADDFEGVFFGKYPLSRAKYEQNLDRIERFRNLLQQASHG